MNKNIEPSFSLKIRKFNRLYNKKIIIIFISILLSFNNIKDYNNENMTSTEIDKIINSNIEDIFHNYKYNYSKEELIPYLKYIEYSIF